MFQIGDITIHLLCDSKTMIDPGGMFGLVPRPLWSRYYPPTDDHMIPSNELCLLVQTQGQNILVDTGMGLNKLDERAIRRWQLTRPHGSLFDGLARLGLTAQDINIVINTHLHADHCTGNTTFNPDGTLVPSFPKARHVVQRREYDDATHPNERTRGTYYPHNFEPLMLSGQLELLDGDTEIVSGVRAVVTPGHTPGHMSVVFESNDQYAIFLCDLASQAIHFERLGWMTAYDVEPLVTLETKRHWQQWAIQHDALLFVVHDWQTPVARLVQDDSGKLTMQAVPYTYS